MCFDVCFYFVNVNFFKEVIEVEVECCKGKFKFFILDVNSINSVDSSGLYVLEEICEFLVVLNIEFYMMSVKGLF